MSGHTHTDEFSIILILDKAASKDIEKIRNLLPPSPYRDDKPHVTLLRGIIPPVHLADEALIDCLQPALDKILNVEPHLKVSRLLNLSGGPYVTTSAIILSSSEDLRREHISLMAYLRGSGFKLERDAHFYYPHATVRLGVPFNTKASLLGSDLFPPGRGVRLSHWEILRLKSSSTRRPFYEIKP